MARTNRPVTSREYKLILKKSCEQEWRQLVADTWPKLIDKATAAGGRAFTKQGRDKDIERRKTWYLDTDDKDLKQNGIALRVREDEGAKSGGKYKITLKFRAFDRYVSAASDLSSSQGKLKSRKFEEDVTPAIKTTPVKKQERIVLISRYSRSGSLNLPDEPDLSTVKKLKRFFPGLKKPLKGVDNTKSVEKVRSFVAHETAVHMGKFRFGLPSCKGCEAIKIKVCMSFWHDTKERTGMPLVAELSYDYDEPKKGKKYWEFGKRNKNGLERYPNEVCSGSTKLFKSLAEDKDLVDVNGTTKTAFAYRYGQEDDC